jgi:membrane associated rhomboid family serine protease
MRSIPTITKNLLIINILAFLAYYVLSYRGMDLNDMFGLHFFLASDFKLYQFITYMFMHGGWDHLFFNMFALWMFGCVVERVWGPKKFLFYYILCGVGAGLIQEISQYCSLYYIMSGQVAGIGFFTPFTQALSDVSMANSLNAWTTVGASGAIYAILLAFGMIFPEERIFIFPLPIPIKAKWFVIFYAAVELFSAMGTSGDNVAHFAHLGGMLFGFLLIRYWQKHPDREGVYGRNNGQQFFDKLRNNWERRSNKKSNDTTTHNPDWDYNARQKATEEEIDIILDKIRKNGYASLTKEEKEKLFNSSNKR